MSQSLWLLLSKNVVNSLDIVCEQTLKIYNTNNLRHMSHPCLCSSSQFHRHLQQPISDIYIQNTSFLWHILPHLIFRVYMFIQAQENLASGKFLIDDDKVARVASTALDVGNGADRTYKEVQYHTCFNNTIYYHHHYDSLFIIIYSHINSLCTTWLPAAMCSWLHQRTKFYSFL